jgi:hypothetical protein
MHRSNKTYLRRTAAPHPYFMPSGSSSREAPGRSQLDLPPAAPSARPVARRHLANPRLPAYSPLRNGPEGAGAPAGQTGGRRREAFHD